MADNPEPSTDNQITFKVKTSSESTHSITMNDTATVLDLKTKLAGEAYENIPVERQRLIYSGRVMKNDDTLSTYKIKHNNTIHMVKSAASNQQPNQTPTANTSTSTPAPANMASGTANQPFANLTGARYAGFGNGLPGLDMFGPDGGMGAPMDEARIQRLMSDPNVQQSMNEALNNPDFINMLIDSNPMLRNLPNAREIITSPFMRQMMSNPEMMSQAMRMQRSMQGGEAGAFPAPGATDTTPQGAASGGNAQSQQSQQNPFANPFMPMMGGQQGGNPPDIAQLMQQLQGLRSLYGGVGQGQTATGTTGTGNTPNQGATDSSANAPTSGTTPSQDGSQQGSTTSPPPVNPFAALFPPPGAGAQPNNPFGLNPEMMQQMMQMLGGGMDSTPAAPADNRPPEERYAEQLRQLNDMGFFDFDRNVAALRRSGGSVQGAIEYLLSGP
ncbi:Deubiquitination-protection dph1 [Fusarium beomiforme]|uniref:Deubiquitination-protection dph1 n=1 Tax=Fusarium beomiforme TaxID=44412 RepID=A0A9P5AR28_9HYPO|nr:Deubiquitination-protection dph1 [Fusarium beomiforme]